jgi:hypothetical protein
MRLCGGPVANLGQVEQAVQLRGATTPTQLLPDELETGSPEAPVPQCVTKYRDRFVPGQVGERLR